MRDTREAVNYSLQQTSKRIDILKKLCKECPFDSTFKNMLADEEARFKDLAKQVAALPPLVIPSIARVAV